MFSSHISSATPAYIIIILDQSSRMLEPYSGGVTKAEFQCKLVNDFITEIININMDGDKIKDRFFISLFGHSNSQVNDLRSDYVSFFGNNLLRIEKVKKKVSNGAGGQVEIDEEIPVFIEPISEGEEAQLSAFNYSFELTKGWNSKKDNKYPLIINVSGGFPSKWKETTQVVNEIKNIGNDDKHPTIFNLLLETGKTALLFPPLEEIYCKSFTSNLYFEWSSYVNSESIENARRYDLNLNQSSKMFSNLRIIDIIKLINLDT